MQIKIKGDNIIETDNLSLAELQNLNDEMQIEIDKMSANIFEVRATQKATGEYANIDWFKRLNLAIKLTRRNRDKLVRVIAGRRREERQEKSLNEGERFKRLFMQTTFEMVGAAQYQLILAETQRRIEEAQETQILR